MVAFLSKYLNEQHSYFADQKNFREFLNKVTLHNISVNATLNQ